MGGKEVRAGKAFVEIALRDKLEAGLKKASAKLKAFGIGVAAIGGTLEAASGAILGPMAAALTQFASVGSAVADMSARTGASAESLSALGYAATMTGASMEDVEKGVRKMQQTIVDAATGGDKAAKALASLGLSASDLVGLSPEQQMQKIADGLSRIEDPALRTAIAMDIMGKGGAALIPMMSGGASGLAAFRAEAEKLGLVMSTEDAEAADQLGDSMDRVKGSIRGVTMQIGAALAPAAIEAANRITAIVASVSQFIKENRGLVVQVAKIAIGIGVAGAAFMAIGGASLVAAWALRGFAAMGTVLPTIIGAISARFSAAIGTVLGVSKAFSIAANRVLAFSRMGVQAGIAIGTSLGRVLTSGAGSALTLAGSLASLGASAVRLGSSAVSSAARIAASMGPPLWNGITTAASATVAGVRVALSAASAAVGALARGWTGDIGMFTNKVNTAFWTLGAKTRDYITTLRSGGLSQALAMARTDFWSLVGSASGAFRAISRTVFTSAASLRSAITSKLVSAWGVVRVAAESTFAKIRQVGSATTSFVGRGLRGMGRSLSQGVTGITGALGAIGGLMGGTGLGAVLMSVPMITSVLGGLGAAVTALLSPFGLVVAAIAGGIYAWTQWSQTGRTVLTMTTAAFQQIWATVSQVFAGISKALAGGDIKLAAQILWAGLKTLFYQGAAAIQQVWPLVAQGVGQAWQYVSDTASSLLTWLASAWGQLPGWVTASLGAVASSFGSLLAPAFTWISDQFSQLTAWAGETFQGISNAIAAGDWGLAFEVAWASIKVAWTKGISWITQTWSEATTGLAMMFDGAVTAIRQVWGNVITWIATKLVQMYDGAMQILNAIAQWDPTGLAQRLHDAMAIDTQGVLRNLQQDNQQNNRGLEQGLQQRNNARGQALLDQQKAAEAELARLRQQRDDALARAQAAGGSPGTGGLADRAQQAQAELQAALDRAAAMPGMFDANAAQNELQGPSNDAMAMAAMDSGGKGLSSKGTFSGAAIWGMSAGGVNERAAKAAESTASNTKQLVDASKRNRLVFG